MLQVRKLVLAVAAASALSTGVAHALSLGDVSVKSYLGQPLEAEIELTDIKGLDSSEVKSQLASLEEFSRHGIERQFFLSNIKFTPVINQTGKSYIRVTTERAISEPYVSFLLELYWPSGRALREYTLLMDPPMYSPQAVVAEAAEVLESSEEPQSIAPATPREAEKALTPQPKREPARQQVSEPTKQQPASQKRAPQQSSLVAGSKHRVAKNESLWAIASRVEGDGSIYQKMIAIVDQNPQAFIGGDINKLRAGAQLTLPNEEQVLQSNKRSALNQYQDLQRKPLPSSGAGQLDARQLDRAGDAPAMVSSEDNLRLISSETGESQVGSDRGGSSRASEEVSAQLAESKEQLDSVRMENADLRERVQELDEQLDRLQKLVELKNAQLANLQNMPLSELAEADNVSEQSDFSSDSETQVEQGVTETLVEPELSQLQDDAELEASSLTQDTAVESEQVEPEVVEEAPKPAPVKPVVMDFDDYEEASFVDEILDNPLFLPAVGGAGLVAMIMLLLVARKRKAAKESAELQAENEAYAAANPFEDEQDAPDDDFANLDDITEDTVNLDDIDLDDSVQESTPDSFKQEQSKGGVLAEVEGYIAYGRFNEAASMLMQAIDSEPERADLRFKLLEVFADLDDRNGFARQISELEDMGVSQSDIAEVKARYPSMANDSFGLAASDIDMPDLDSLGLGLDGNEDEAATASESTEPTTESIEEDPLAGLDFSDFAADAGLGDSTSSLEAEDETFDLGDFDFSEPQSAASEELEIADTTLEPAEELDELSLTLNELDNLEQSTTDSGEQELEFSLDDALGDLSLDELATEATARTSDDIDFSADLDLSVADEPLVIDEPKTEADVELEDDFAALNEELDSLAESMAPEAASDDELGSLLEEAEELSTDFDLDALDLDAEIPELETTATDEISLEDGLADFDLDSLADLEVPADEQVPESDLSGLGDFDLPELGELPDMPELEDVAGIDELPAFDDIEDLSATEEEQPASLSGDLEDSLGDDFDFLAGTDETTTKLDLARAYVDMGDSDGARDILEEIMSEGTDEQQQMAQELMKKLG